MLNYIDEIWIIKSGIVLYHYGEKLMDDCTTIGAILSCFETVISNCFSETLSNIKFKNCILLFHKQDNLLFVAKTSLIQHEKKVLNEFANIIQFFYNQYDDSEITNWTGNTRYFNALNKKYAPNIVMTF